MMVYFAMMAAIVPFVGQNWGAGEYGRVHTAQKESNRFSFLWGLAGLLFFAAFAGRIGAAFSADPVVVNGIRDFLVISAFGYSMRGVCMMAVSLFNAINRPMNALVLNLVRMFFLYIPLSYIGAAAAGLNGVFWGMALANIIAGAAAFLWVRRTCRVCENIG